MRSVLHTAAFALALICAPPATADTPAEMATVNGQYLAYNIYTGGLKTLSADLKIWENSPQSYQVAMSARTDGLLKIFKKWEGTMETQGHHLEDGGKLPARHESVSIWPDNTQIKAFAWNETGSLENFYLLEEGETKGLADIENDIAHNTVDILSASLSIMEAAASTGTCEGQSEVFDGKRRFLLSAVNKGVEHLKAGRYNKFGGEALRCEIKITPQEGDWHEKLKGWMAISEEGRQAGAAPTVWLARINENGPAVPVKLQAKTSYGTFMMHISGHRRL